LASAHKFNKFLHLLPTTPSDFFANPFPQYSCGFTFAQEIGVDKLANNMNIIANSKKENMY
jgi:hypothetical protein